MGAIYTDLNGHAGGRGHGSRRAPLNVSDASLRLLAPLPTLVRVLGQENVVVPPPPWMAADDFACLAAEVPAFFALGTVQAGHDVRRRPRPRSSPTMPVGMRAVAHIVKLLSGATRDSANRKTERQLWRNSMGVVPVSLLASSSRRSVLISRLRTAYIRAKFGSATITS